MVRRRLVLRAGVSVAAFAGGLGLSVVAFGAGTPASVTITEKQAYSGPLATYTAGCGGGCEGYIESWGDGNGTPTNATISPGTGTTTIARTLSSGPHTYATKGVYTVISRLQAGATSQNATTPVTVVDAPVALSASAIDAAAGVAFTGPLATFTDPGPTRPAGVYQARVDWGDGTGLQPATVTAGDSGGFVVSGTHTYADGGDRTFTVTVDEDGDGQPSTASAAARVDAIPPTATFTYDPPQLPIAGAPLTFTSTGPAVGPATFAWKVCPVGAPADQCQNGSGSPFTRSFSLFNPHDPERFDSTGRRRSSFDVTLTVTDRFGRSASTTQPLTVVADMPPLASFSILPELRPPASGKLGKAKAYILAESFGSRNVLEDVKLTSTSEDPDPGDAIVEQRWDLSGDGLDDLSCRPFIGCKNLPGAFQYPNTAKAPPKPPDKKLQKKKPVVKGPPLEELFGFGSPQEFGFDAPAGFQGQTALQVVQARQRAALRQLGPGSPLYVPDDLPALSTERYVPPTFNFARMHISQEAYFGPKAPLPVELKNPSPSTLYAYSVAADGFSQMTTDPKFPKEVRLTVVDRAGVESVATQPIAFRNARYPRVAMEYVRLGTHAADDPILDTEPFNLSFGKAVDPDGKVRKVVLTLGRSPAPGKLFSDDASTHTKYTADSIEGLRAAYGQGPTFASLGGAGRYTAVLSVYDDQGLGVHAYVTNLEVASLGACQAIDKALSNAKSLRVQGDCVDVLDGGKTLESGAPLKINGLDLVPPPGGTLRVRNSSKPAVWAVGGQGQNAGHVIVGIDGTPVGRYQAASADAGAGLFAAAGAQVPVIQDAVLRGLPVAQDSLVVDFGDSLVDVDAQLTLPSAFGSGEQPVTSPFDVRLKAPKDNAVFQQFVVNGPYDLVGASASAARRGGAGARAAALPGFQLGPMDTMAGPVPVKDLLLKYDDTLDEWTGSGTVSIPGLDQVGPVSARFRVRGDQLTFVGGTVSVPGGVPVGPGVFAKSFSFELTFGDDPAAAAGITFTAAQLIDGTGQVKVKTKTGLFRFDGTISLAGILKLGSGYLQIDPGAGSLAFGGRLGATLGPASFSASVDGWANTQKQFAIVGRGEACLFACLDITALVSNIGVAGCGEIDLLFTSVSAGFGYTFATKDVDVFFNSCDLAPYQPKAAAAARSQLRAVPAGQSSTVEVAAGQSVLALRLPSVDPKAGPPKVTVTGPASDGRVISTPLAGEYSFGAQAPVKGGTYLIDADPISGVTSVVVAKPTPGTWTVRVDQGAITGVQTARALPAIGTKDLSASVSSGGKGKASAAALASSAARTATTSAATKAGVLKKGVVVAAGATNLPAIEKKRLRVVDYAVGAIGGGKVQLIVRSANGQGQLLGTVPSGQKGSIVFDPPQTAGKQEVVAMVLRPDGLPRLARPLDSFTAPPAAKPGAVTVGKVSRVGGQLQVVLKNAPTQRGRKNALAYVLDVDTGRGGHQRVPVFTRDVRRTKAGWVTRIGDLGFRGSVKVSARAAYRSRLGKAGTRSIAATGKAPRRLKR